MCETEEEKQMVSPTAACKTALAQGEQRRGGPGAVAVVQKERTEVLGGSTSSARVCAPGVVACAHLIWHSRRPRVP